MDDEELTPILSQGSPDYLAQGVLSVEHLSEEDSSGTISPVNVKIVNSSDSKSESEASMSMVSGSLNSMNMFLTYPQCNIDPKIALDLIIKMFSVQYAVVAHELHKDGSPHLHCVVKLKSRKKITFLTLDKITGKRGNYQSARNIDKCLKYCAKNGEWVAYEIDLLKHLKEIEEKKKTKSTVIAEIIESGGTFMDCWKADKGYAFANKRKIDDCIDFFELKKYKKLKLEWEHALQVLALSPLIDTPKGELICSWLYRNIRKPRKFKQKQLMIYGPPNTGKTSLVHFLEKHLKIYHMTDDDYDDNWKNNYYDLAVMDEFRGQKKIIYWNKWLQGGTMPLKVRYRAPNKEGNIPTLICGNFDLETCYHNCDYTRIAPMYERIETVETTEYLEIKE